MARMPTLILREQSMAIPLYLARTILRVCLPSSYLQYVTAACTYHMLKYCHEQKRLQIVL